MADRSKIEWTEASWNPIRARVGGLATERIGWHCEIVSPGCENCYAQAMNKRLGTHRSYLRRERENVGIYLDEKALTAPLRWRRPRRIFVCSMSDLFGEWVPDEMLDRVFAVMALCPQHTFQVLTKRAARMRKYLATPRRDEAWWEAGDRAVAAGSLTVRDWGPADAGVFLSAAPGETELPLPNVWLGVSVEDQRRADERIPELLATPAAVRWVSAEPLLGLVNLSRISLGVSAAEFLDMPHITKAEFTVNALKGARSINWGKLDWVVAGGESGAGARPMRLDWARSLRDQCTAPSVPFFFKQWGEWIDADQWFDRIEAGPLQFTIAGKPWCPVRPLNYTDAEQLAQLRGRTDVEHQSDGSTLIRVGKRSAGRLLDGRTWDEYPA